MPKAAVASRGKKGKARNAPAPKKMTTKAANIRNWATTDEDELNRRRLRAREETFTIRNLDAAHKIFSNFSVKSRSGMTYRVEIRDIAQRHFFCTCRDFRVNGLGSCKHLEAVLLRLQARFPRLYRQAEKNGSERIDVVVDSENETLCVERGLGQLPPPARKLFNGASRSIAGGDPEHIYERLCKIDHPALRLSEEIGHWLHRRTHERERTRLRWEYEQKVHSGEFPMHETRVPLYPYQRDGMLHLAFTERALLADEMGLGKTIQAIAACALLNRMGKARRALVVAPASLKTEWEEQIQQFTDLSYQVVYGPRRARLARYDNPPFFTIVNYEQVRSDTLDMNQRLGPDIVILDEAQRIKNWSTATAQSVKRLESRYAFVLTGTPIENRIDEIYSIVDFLDPTVFGPLFRFNRHFYELDERGRPADYRNLRLLQAKIGPLMKRRRKGDVESELPGRTIRNYFVPMSDEQKATYAEHQSTVARLMAIAKRRPLTKQQQEKLMRELAMMRMICDTNYILDPGDKVCPKLEELDKVFDDVLADSDVKIVLFSEWVRMLDLVRELCRKKGIGCAWHTGSVPQRKRRAEIMLFKSDPDCRVFICSESGGVGLNLQNAGMVINCDLPWNPAKLEQRIARVWRKHQRRNVTVINLISEYTIEHRMLDTLAAKQGLAEGVLDNIGDLSKITMRRGADSFYKRLEQVMMTPEKRRKAPYEMLPVERSAAFAADVREELKQHLVACEEHFPEDNNHSVIVTVVDRDCESRRHVVQGIHERYFGPEVSDPASPVHCELIDRSAWETLGRLEDMGLVQRSVRAVRPLYPSDEQDEKQLKQREERTRRFKAHYEKKLKMARLLVGGGMPEEARPAVVEAITFGGRAFAEKHGLPAPEEASGALVNPIAPCWSNSAAPLKEFLSGEVGATTEVLAHLETAGGAIG